MVQNMTTSSALITRLSPAKINLFLHIVGKRADGYHHLQTVFRLLDWGDYLHFLTTGEADLSALLTQNITIEQQAAERCAKLITLSGANAITDDLADNLIIKAARALLAYTLSLNKCPNRLPHVNISIDKYLPMGAGLGGGSSNAATTLLVLNELWQLNVSHTQLRTIGAKLGADVPIFIFGRDAIAMGIGEQLMPIKLPNQQYLLLTPNAHINTAQLFAHSALRRDIAALSSATIRTQAAYYAQALCAPYHNVFTPVVESLAPAVAQALQYLRELEPQALGVARMTGSGSAVFLPLDKSVGEDDALLANWINNAPCSAYIVNNL